MREDLKPGNVFPDFELPNHANKTIRLSEYVNGWPTILIFSRGYY